ncbi:diadenosine 5',5'''-P1,P4-tetraphosphate asymmetrical hydrolase [Russula earlei]|uniref:Diadenosine 5',5'''-P1,P4-tetraphosphate asymmetrical hydrolase n=1 Tax=Russula earlei TaxID=71964 RepID=A0ACC0UB90_9AGAM|nr:diadenosine 5',5'''-P1,P4-tetraphosphate asymmetrical hydrolase [Russula earlei]
MLFSTFEVTRQAFHRTSLAYAIVNLKPIVPGHVLVCSTRPVPRLVDLREDELAELMCTVQRVGRVIEHAYKADGLTIACQDGRASGQTVPHVHFHILPRNLRGDRFAGSQNDAVYRELEKQEGTLPQDLAVTSQSHTDSRDLEPLRMDADEAREPRTLEDMEQEARWLAGFFEADRRGNVHKFKS